MEMKNMVVVLGLLLIAAAFALPAAFAERDFISHETVQGILKKVGSDSALKEQFLSALSTKTIISNPILEEALFKQPNSIIGVTGREWCRESCVYIGCLSVISGCHCDRGDCRDNSLA